jgi:sugar lactone lactonase YvrE
MSTMRKPIFLRFVPGAAVVAAMSLFAANAHAAVGDIYETNQPSEGVVLRINPNGGTPVTWAIGLVNPKGIVFDGAGKLYVADAGRGVIIQYTVPDGTNGFTFAVNLASPVGLTFSAAGELYVGEAGNGKVSKYDVATGIATEFASGLGQPAGLVFANNGDLLIADFASGTIFRVAPDGTKSTFASGFNLPAGLAFDRDGILFVADSGSGSIIKVAPDGTKTTFATGLSQPFGLAFEAAGTLVVADNGNGGTFRFATDGTRSNIFSSQFNTPQFVAIEPASHQLLNISTRGFVAGGDHVLIAGFNIGGLGPVGIKVVIRALGPSLADAGIVDPLADPALEVRDASGTLVAFNNNWQDASDAQKVTNTVLQPTNPNESALQLSLLGGAYTAIVYGANETTGTSVVEVYALQ